MLKKSALALTLAATCFASPAFADKFEIDKSHTNIIFFVNHLGFSDMIGKFNDFDGGFTFDEKAPEKSTIDFTIRPAGIQTSSAPLDKELQGEKYFYSEKYPTIHFVSNAVKITGEKTGDVTGDLTMLGVTKPVTFHITFNKGDYHPMTHFYMAGFSAEGVVKRSDFGFTQLVPMVGDDVRVIVQTEGKDLDRAAAEAMRKQ